jgi:hypothetical protein
VHVTHDFGDRLVRRIEFWPMTCEEAATMVPLER